jgi:hypothetical protein
VLQLPFVDSFIELLPLLRRTSPSLTACQTHHKSGSYFCNDCQEYLCSDCIYEIVCQAGNPHQGHSIDKLTSKIGDIKRDFEGKLRILASTQQTVVRYANTLMSFAPTLVAAREDALLSLYDSFGQMQAKYEQSVSDEIDALTIKRQKVELRLKTLHILDQDSEFAIENCPLSAIAHTDEFCEHVRQAAQLATEGLETPHHQIENDLVPSFSSATIKFERLKETREAVVMTEPIELDGNEWRIKFYPSGAGEHRMSTHASLFVELLDGFQQPTQVIYRIEIEAASFSQPNIVHEFAAVPSIGQAWGWRKFHSSAVLCSDDYLDETGAMIIIFSVRPDSYHTLWKWIKAGNERKQEKLKALRARGHGRTASKLKPPT